MYKDLNSESELCYMCGRYANGYSYFPYRDHIGVTSPFIVGIKMKTCSKCKGRIYKEDSFREPGGLRKYLEYCVAMEIRGPMQGRPNNVEMSQLSCEKDKINDKVGELMSNVPEDLRKF